MKKAILFIIMLILFFANITTGICDYVHYLRNEKGYMIEEELHEGDIPEDCPYCNIKIIKKPIIYAEPTIEQLAQAERGEVTIMYYELQEFKENIRKSLIEDGSKYEYNCKKCRRIFYTKKEKTKEEAKKRGPLPAVSKRDTVTISGEIIFEDYEKAPIIVYAASEGHMGPPDIASVKIPKPGKYVLKVPANAGNINLLTMNKRLKDRPMPNTPVGEYEENPLKVGSSNIAGVDIRITREFQLKIKPYEGPTITISGEVMVEGYERGGRIIVAAWSGDYGDSPPIAGKELPRPGKYTLKVPVNAGSIRMTAMYVPAGEVKKLRQGKPSAGAYEKNPLKVGSSNIGGINIVIKD